MAVRFFIPANIAHYIGLSTDIKPTTESCLITQPGYKGNIMPKTGSSFFEYDTGDFYITYDGTNWVLVKNPLILK